MVLDECGPSAYRLQVVVGLNFLSVRWPYRLLESNGPTPHAQADALRALIQFHVAAGVDQIKLYAGLDAGMVRAGVAEAHRLGKFVVAHLSSTRAEEAALSGLNEIEHFD